MREEIQTAIKQLNNGKSSLDIESEILKCASTIPNLEQSLQQYFKEIWTSKQIPQQWTISKIVPIWKGKGNAMDPTKYRGISIGTVLCKVGMNIILKRLSTFYDEQLKRTQFGFRAGMGCNDGIYMLKQLQDIATLSQRKLYICFVDLTAAFDHVNRNLLFKTIRQRLPPNQDTTNLDIIEQLYMSTRSYIQNSTPDNSFATTSGVRQGGMEGPPLFNLFGDYVLRVFDSKKEEMGIEGLAIPFKIPDTATNRAQKAESPANGTCNDDDCGYADDLGVICWNLSYLQGCMDALVKVFEEYGLTLNISKTETMILNHQITPEENYPDSIIKINGKNIDNNTDFKYLGVWMNNNSLLLEKEKWITELALPIMHLQKTKRS